MDPTITCPACADSVDASISGPIVELGQDGPAHVYLCTTCGAEFEAPAQRPWNV